jgi:hypothetical protein
MGWWEGVQKWWCDTHSWMEKIMENHGKSWKIQFILMIWRTPILDLTKSCGKNGVISCNSTCKSRKHVLRIWSERNEMLLRRIREWSLPSKSSNTLTFLSLEKMEFACKNEEFHHV